MRAASSAVRPVECPPKPQANGPKQIEVLRGIGAIGVGAELGIGTRVDVRLNEKEQPAGAFQPLGNAFRAEEPAVHSQYP